MTTRRLISTEIWEPQGFETYLEEMEASGLRLAKAGGWLLYFDRAQPRGVHPPSVRRTACTVR